MAGCENAGRPSEAVATVAGAAEGLAAVSGIIRWHWWVIKEGHRRGGGDAAKGAAERHPAAPHDFVIGVFGSLDGHGVEELVDGFKVAGAITEQMPEPELLEWKRTLLSAPGCFCEVACSRLRVPFFFVF